MARRLFSHDWAPTARQTVHVTLNGERTGERFTLVHLICKRCGRSSTRDLYGDWNAEEVARIKKW